MNETERSAILAQLKEKVRSYPDFPKPGVIFKDIFSLLNDPEDTRLLRDVIIYHVRTLPSLDCVVGLDSRGFIFGTMIAIELGIPFVPIRKSGKLPGKLFTASYELEYGTDTLQIQADSISPGAKVLIIDDLLATGGTLGAACKLIKMVKADVIECFVIIEIIELNGRKKVSSPVHSLLQY